MKILHLTLKKKWYDMILSGEKLEEYRETKEYWSTRLRNKQFDIIRFRNGYKANAPSMDVEFKGVKFGEAKGSWSDNAEGIFYVISLGKVMNAKSGESVKPLRKPMFCECHKPFARKMPNGELICDYCKNPKKKQTGR
jgi:hypothetical protein